MDDNDENSDLMLALALQLAETESSAPVATATIVGIAQEGDGTPAYQQVHEGLSDELLIQLWQEDMWQGDDSEVAKFLTAATEADTKPSPSKRSDNSYALGSSHDGDQSSGCKRRAVEVDGNCGTVKERNTTSAMSEEPKNACSPQSAASSDSRSDDCESGIVSTVKTTSEEEFNHCLADDMEQDCKLTQQEVRRAPKASQSET